MTRHECFSAINVVYGARATARIDDWNILIETQPLRILLLATDFVEANIDNNGMSPSEFEANLRDIPENRWVAEADGRLYLVLHND